VANSNRKKYKAKRIILGEKPISLEELSRQTCPSGRGSALFNAETDADDLSPVSKLFHEQFPLSRGVEVLCFLPSTHYPLYDFDLRATHARTLLPAALASVSYGFVLVRVRVRVAVEAWK
jgi:hypothetical protein